MKMRSTTSQIAGAIGAITLLLAACGDDNSSTDSAGATDTETEMSTDTASEVDGATDEASEAGMKSVEDVLREISEMGLSYEERIDYLYEKAKEEGAVLLYGSPDVELQADLSNAFMEAYPEINALYVRQRSDDIYERILSEARSGRHLVDVVYANAVIGAALKNEDLIADHFNVPIPEYYGESFVEPWAAVGFIQPKVITWNTNNLDEADVARDWDDFLEPEYAGCAIDAGPQSFLGVMLKDRGEDGTVAWLEAFLENDGVVRRGHSASTQALAAGEFDCAVYLYANDVQDYIADGAPLAWYAADPTPGHSTSVYIYNHTNRPHAAALFMHFALDDVGAQVAADQNRLAVNPHVELQHAELAPFIEPGSDLNQRLVPMYGADALEWADTILNLQETYLVPNLVQN